LFQSRRCRAHDLAAIVYAEGLRDLDSARVADGGEVPPPVANVAVSDEVEGAGELAAEE
jgi:hypothetical protein